MLPQLHPRPARRHRQHRRRPGRAAAATCGAYDGDDPYLVVAADKGTATFSDIANAISAEYGFWLGDAFASGGSAGYDHKKMAITARGAWECVKRHFRELGVDIQREPFTRRRHRRHVRRRVRQRHAAIAAHPAGRRLQSPAHLPRPETRTPRRSFRERERLFRLPRSSWNDYNARLLSRGGGIFERAAKSVTLSREAQALLELPQRARQPGRDHARHSAHARRPAVERRHRHLRQGQRTRATARSAIAPTTRCASTAASCAHASSARAAISASRSAAASNTPPPAAASTPISSTTPPA